MSRRAVIALALVAAVAVGIALLVPAVGDRLRAAWNTVTRGPGDAAPMPGPMAPPPAIAGDAPPRGEVVIDARRQQLIGIRTVPVQRTTLVQELRASGVVRADETRQAEISTRVDGWIRDLRADYTGRTITRGEQLFTLYSPALLAAQNEFLLAHRGHAAAAGSEIASVRDHAERLVAAARERLLRLELSEADIRDLEQRGRATDTVPFRSPATGTIVEKLAVEGMRVTAGQTLFRVADLSVVWVEASIPAGDMALVRVGQPARVTLPGRPELVGRTVYVYPTVDEQTRTGTVRLQLPNRDGQLRPGMFADVLLTGADVNGLTVPVDALLEAGADRVVFVALGEGRFEPRQVMVGRRSRDEVEITAGLTEGELVVSGAAFLLDSESQLRAAVQGFQGAPGAAATTAPQSTLDIRLTTQPDPPRAGENTFEVTVRDASGAAVTDADVALTFFMAAMPTMNMPAMRNQVRLPAAGNGVYRGAGQVVMAGRWDVTVDISRGSQRLGSRQLAVVAR